MKTVKKAADLQPKQNQNETKQKPNVNVDVDVNVNENEDVDADEDIGTEPAVSTPPVITFPLNTGEEYPVFQDHIQEWERLYPAVDVMQELRKMRGWLSSNPAKRKTKTGIMRFINAWLAKEQDRGGTVQASPSPKRGKYLAASDMSSEAAKQSLVKDMDRMERLLAKSQGQESGELK